MLWSPEWDHSVPDKCYLVSWTEQTDEVDDGEQNNDVREWCNNDMHMLSEWTISADNGHLTLDTYQHYEPMMLSNHPQFVLDHQWVLYVISISYGFPVSMSLPRSSATSVSQEHSTHASGCTENSAKCRLAAENSANASDINESINLRMLCLSRHTDRP